MRAFTHFRRSSISPFLPAATRLLAREVKLDPIARRGVFQHGADKSERIAAALDQIVHVYPIPCGEVLKYPARGIAHLCAPLKLAEYRQNGDDIRVKYNN